MKAPSVEELELAATWLEHYELGPAGEGAEEVEGCQRVAAMLRRQAAALERRRRDAEVVARAAAESGRSVQECRRALRRLQARQASTR